MGLRLRSKGTWKGQVERKSERSTDSRDAADNISAINGAAVPSVSGSSVRSLNKDGVSATIIRTTSSDTVTALLRNMEVNGKNSATSLEESFTGAAVINDN